MRNTSKRAGAHAILSTLCLGASAATFGQASEGGLEEVIVTAQKRAERLQDVPITVNALGGDAIAERRISSADDLVKEFPNLSLKASSAINSGFSIRGVGTQNIHLTAQQAVGQYMDEVSLVTPFTSQLGLFDMERIEVLRGPQNTLFGRNTTGGAVNYITRKPDVGEGVNGYARVNVGNFARIDGEGAVGLPLGETFAMRIAAQVQTRDGVFEDVATGRKVGETRRYSGRLGVAWEPSEDTSVLLTGHVGYNRGERSPRKAVGRFSADGVSACPAISDGTNQFEGVTDCVAVNKAGVRFNPSLPGWRQVYDANNNTADVDFEGGLLRASHDFGSFSLVSLTSFDRTKVHFADELSALPYLQFQANQQAQYDTFSQELRLASEGTGPLRWIAGAFYAHEEDELITIVRNNAVGPPTRSVVPSVIIDQKINISSLYGQLDYRLTDKLNLNGGLRWTRDNKAGDRTAIAMFDTTDGLASGTRLPADFLYTRSFIEQNGSTFTTPCAPGVVPCAGPVQRVSQELSKYAGKIGVDYHFTDDVMAYASYSTGFKSGAFDIRAQAVFNGSGNTPVKPESLDAYEIGVKSSLADRRVQINVSLFRYDWKDLQAFGSLPGVGPAFLNLPKSKLTGEELEVQVAAGAGWILGLNAAHLDTEVMDVGTLGPDVATRGSPLQQSPDWSFTANVEKSVDIGGNELNARLAGRYTGEQFTTLTRGLDSRISPASLLDASVTYVFGASGKYSVGLWGENLTGEKTCSMITTDGISTTNICLANEGTALFGATFSAQF